MESSKETGCQAPEGPILCVNNCGFFGSTATMNMCSKCHKEMILKEEQAKLAASSIDNIVNRSSSSCEIENIVNRSSSSCEIENIVNRSSSSCEKDSAFARVPSVRMFPLDINVFSTESPCNFTFGQTSDGKAKELPSRCTTCRKRVGLTGFNCRCGHLYCAMHRYSDKHDCPFDYHKAAQSAIAKENPVVKAEKLDKI